MRISYCQFDRYTLADAICDNLHLNAIITWAGILWYESIREKTKSTMEYSIMARRPIAFTVLFGRCIDVEHSTDLCILSGVEARCS